MRWNRISSDEDTVDYWLGTGQVEPEPPSEADLIMAQEVLAMWGASDPESAQQVANVIGLLEAKIVGSHRRKAVADAKRRYAAEHGLSVKQVRLKR